MIVTEGKFQWRRRSSLTCLPMSGRQLPLPLAVCAGGGAATATTFHGWASSGSSISSHDLAGESLANSFEIETIIVLRFDLQSRIECILSVLADK
jgi:hypothetical protein